MKLVNCTPHDVVITDVLGMYLSFPASGICPRVSSKEVPTDTIEVGGSVIATCRREYGAVEGLPEPAEDTLYIVSSMVKAACPDRADLVVPHDFYRNEKGDIVACKKFAI